MTKILTISSFKNCNGSKVNVIYTGVECLFFIPNWGAVCFARVDVAESERQQKTVYRVYGDLGTRAFNCYTKKLQKMYKENGIKKPIELIFENCSNTYLSNIDINFSL